MVVLYLETAIVSIHLSIAVFPGAFYSCLSCPLFFRLKTSLEQGTVFFLLLNHFVNFVEKQHTSIQNHHQEYGEWSGRAHTSLSQSFSTRVHVAAKKSWLSNIWSRAAQFLVSYYGIHIHKDLISADKKQMPAVRTQNKQKAVKKRLHWNIGNTGWYSECWASDFSLFPVFSPFPTILTKDWSYVIVKDLMSQLSAIV